MEAAVGSQDTSVGEDCPFCQIVNNETDTEIMQSDAELVCFQDSNPRAAHHYLIIPRTHIDSCKSLKAENIPLVEHMVEMGRSILEKNNICDDIRMGFHIPPFTSVPHLHLHALAPASKMNIKSRLRYQPLSLWFITVDNVLSQLRTQGKVK